MAKDKSGKAGAVSEGSIPRTFSDPLSEAADKKEQAGLPPPSAPGALDDIRLPETFVHAPALNDISTPKGQMNDVVGPEETAPPASGPTRVEVVCEGVLGPRLLRKGAVTDDPDYVRLLDDPRGLVKRV